MGLKRNYLSTDAEPALGAGSPNIDPAESRAGPTDIASGELARLRDSVASEPALHDAWNPAEWAQWLDRRKSECRLPGNLGVTLLVALLSGPLAILGALFYGQPHWSAMFYAVVIGPVVEELLKQSGMTYLLEKKPYRLFAAWQFLFAAVVAGLAFAAIENGVYLLRFSAELDAESLERMADFRWKYCTALHVICASIASLGLIRVWRRQCRDRQPAELSLAYPWLVTAMILHGLYNLVVSLFVSFE